MQHLIEPFEPRRLLAAVFPSAVEQYEVELINRARANPAAEAARLGIDLNEGLPAGTISTAAKQPLAINRFITDAARRHSQWMIDNDEFQHEGPGGNSPGQRMTNAGYVFNTPYTWGENIAYRSRRPSVPEPVTTSAQIHADLFIDEGIDGRGHRTNMMKASFKEIGAGIISGEFNDFNAVMVTTDFAASGTGSFVTGVAYNDTLTADNFYTPGEGLGNQTITATRIGDRAIFTTTTFDSGGYNLQLSPGKYILTATGSGFSAPLRHSAVVGSENVKRDFRPSDAGIIRGSVFNDTNRDGVRDSNETGVVGLLLFIDTHKDGKRNGAELYARTNIDGAYKFSGLAPGTYRIRETLPVGEAIISPASGFFEVALGPGKTVGGRTFANAPAVGRAFSAARVELPLVERLIDGLV